MIDVLSDDKFDRSKLRKDSEEEKFAITLNNLKFLKDRKSEIGQLKCEYCNNVPLKIYDFNLNGLKDLKNIGKEKWRLNTKFNREDGATVDHKQPKSKGGDKFNYDNLAVCCYYYNNEKGDMSWIDWQHFLKQKK
jgi:5-methylcytosine-specific restriction endonuclease McrA